MPRKRFSLKLLAKKIRYKKKGSSATTVEIQCSCKLCKSGNTGESCCFSMNVEVNPY